MKPVILTGIRANNNLTIGNYFGAILPMIDMATHHSDEYQVNLFIPDLHSFTTPIDHSLLNQQILDTARFFSAAGLPLENPNIHMYRQSYVSAHSELTWIMSCFAGFGEMRRMTQFKDKSGAQALLNSLNDKIDSTTEQINEINEKLDVTEFSAEHLRDSYVSFSKNIAEVIGDIDQYIQHSESLSASVGLFNYPILMAADILLYNALYVPVGDDQTQHLEFTRDIAERMNSRFGDLFTVPNPVKDQHAFFGKDQGLRIMDLQNPMKKMSKSAESDKGVIFLSDDPDVAAKKVMSAATDDKAHVSFDRENQPGISNLLQILSLLRHQPVTETAAEYEGLSSYGEFKAIVADEVKSFLTDFQSRLAQVDDTAVLSKLQTSETAMNQQANETLLRVQKAIGLRS